MSVDPNVGGKDLGIMQPRKGRPMQKLMYRCRMRGRNDWHAAVGSHENGIGILRVSDLVANHELCPHASHRDLNANGARIPNEYVK